MHGFFLQIVMVAFVVIGGIHLAIFSLPSFIYILSFLVLSLQFELQDVVFKKLLIACNFSCLIIMSLFFHSSMICAWGRDQWFDDKWDNLCKFVILWLLQNNCSSLMLHLFFMTMCQIEVFDIGWFRSWEALTFENNLISTKLFLHEATNKQMIVIHNEFGTNYYY